MVDQAFAQEDASGGLELTDDLRVLWLLADNQGTTRDLIDNTGALATHLTYDPYGNVLDGNASLTTLQFTGKYRDLVTGLQYNINRWYDPATGRWVSADPIGFAGGDVNLYRYVGNGPTNGTDPSGLSVWGWDWFKEWWDGWWSTGVDAAAEVIEVPIPVGTVAASLECVAAAVDPVVVDIARKRYMDSIGKPGEKAAWAEYQRLQNLEALKNCAKKNKK